jgi:hypothetical protein
LKQFSRDISPLAFNFIFSRGGTRLWLPFLFGLIAVPAGFYFGMDDIKLVVWGELTEGEVTHSNSTGQYVYVYYKFTAGSGASWIGMDSLKGSGEVIAGTPISVVYLEDSPKISKSTLTSRWTWLVFPLIGLVSFVPSVSIIYRYYKYGEIE